MPIVISPGRWTSIACMVVILNVIAFGQSGRQKTQKPNPAPAVITLPSPPPAELPTTSQKIRSLAAVGDLIHSYAFHKSNEIDLVLKEFVNAMNTEPRPFIAVTRVGRMSLDEAKARAGKETDTHIIWLGIVTAVDNLGEMVVRHVDYTVLVPSSAKVLITGRINPGRNRIVGQGGVIKVPRVRNTGNDLLLMKQGAREVTYRLKSIGWLCWNLPSA